MISLLCLRFVNGLLDWRDKPADYAAQLLNGNYQKLDGTAETVKMQTNEKSNPPHAGITIHTIQPCGKIMREEESDIPYTEDSDAEYIYPIHRLIDTKENLGKLHFFFSYRPSLKLVVGLVKAEELPEAKDDHPRVYVTISFFSQNSDVNATNEEFKSSVQQGTYSPNFNDSFEFDLSNIKIQETSLRFTVWYVDSFSQGECLGMVDQSLHHYLKDDEKISSEFHEENVICKEIQRISRDFQVKNQNDTHRHGAILFSLTYTQTTKRLTVLLFKAQNLNLTSDDNQGIYAEIAILYVRKSRRRRKVTRSMSGTNNPVYNEAILFDLSNLDTEGMKLQITLKQRRSDKPDKALGRLLLGSDVYDSKAKLHWKNAMNANKAVAQWHSLRQCQSQNYTNRRRLRSRLSCSENDLLTDSSSSDD